MSSKDVKSPMLPKSLPGKNPAPVAQPRWDPDVKDYVVVNGKTSQGASAPSPQGASAPQGGLVPGLLQSGQAVVGEGVGVSPLHPLLSSLGFTKDEAADLLRKEIIKSRSAGGREGTLAESKHYYTSTDAFVITQAETAIAVCHPTGGTGVNQRTGSAIRARKIRLHFNVRSQISATPTAVDPNVTFHWCLFREKVPATPGTCRTVHGTDTNPPTSTTLIFCAIPNGGVNADLYDCMVRNPITEEEDHIYKHHKQICSNGNFSVVNVATGLSVPAPQRWTYTEEVDLHHFQQTYPTYASTSPDINDLWLVLWSSQNQANSGYGITVAVVTDLEFEDEQL